MKLRPSFKEIGSFFKGHWPHLLLALPAVVAFTALHELAHCVAVWVQGGQVTDFVWLPSGAEWGHMQYSFPAGTAYSQTAISLSPYAFWISAGLLAGLLSLRRAPWRYGAASSIFVWLFIVPLADLANAAAPYLIHGSPNDFWRAFGEPSPLFPAVAVFAAILVVVYGYFLNHRLYRERCLSAPAYSILAAVGMLVVLAVSCA